MQKCQCSDDFINKDRKPLLMPYDEDHAFELASAARKAQPQRNRSRRNAPSSIIRLTTPARTSSQTVRRSPTQALGDRYEAWAAHLLTESGCEILARQLRCRFGEIDLAVRQETTLVFVEVRSCQTMRFGGAAASVGRAKQKRLIMAARWWLGALTRDHFDGVLPTCRFDLIAFDSATPVWIRDAFCVT